MSDSHQPNERVLLFASAWFLYKFSYWKIMSFLPVHLTGLGLTRRDVGYWRPAPIHHALTALPFGYLSDWLPGRRLSQAGLCCITLWAAGLAILLGSAASGDLVQQAGLPMPFYATGMICARAGLTFWTLRPSLKWVKGEAV